MVKDVRGNVGVFEPVLGFVEKIEDVLSELVYEFLLVRFGLIQIRCVFLGVPGGRSPQNLAFFHAISS